MSNTNKLFEDFQRSFKFSRFEERKTFGIARNEAIEATCVLHGGSIHEHGGVFNEALKDLCVNHRQLWGDDIRAEDNRWFQHFGGRDNDNNS